MKEVIEAEKVIVEILQTGLWLDKRLNELMKDYGLTSAQYNVLRILKGAYPEQLNPSDIKHRMLFEKSDVTRLIDRMVQKKFVDRSNCIENRRKVNLSISEQGLKKLEQLKPLMAQYFKGFYKDVLATEERILVINKLQKIRNENINPIIKQ